MVFARDCELPESEKHVILVVFRQGRWQACGKWRILSLCTCGKRGLFLGESARTHSENHVGLALFTRCPGETFGACAPHLVPHRWKRLPSSMQKRRYCQLRIRRRMTGLLDGRLAGMHFFMALQRESMVIDPPPPHPTSRARYMHDHVADACHTRVAQMMMFIKCARLHVRFSLRLHKQAQAPRPLTLPARRPFRPRLPQPRQAARLLPPALHQQ